MRGVRREGGAVADAVAVEAARGPERGRARKVRVGRVALEDEDGARHVLATVNGTNVPLGIEALRFLRLLVEQRGKLLVGELFDPAAHQS